MVLHTNAQQVQPSRISWGHSFDYSNLYLNFHQNVIPIKSFYLLENLTKFYIAYSI